MSFQFLSLNKNVLRIISKSKHKSFNIQYPNSLLIVYTTVCLQVVFLHKDSVKYSKHKQSSIALALA